MEPITQQKEDNKMTGDTKLFLMFLVLCRWEAGHILDRSAVLRIQSQRKHLCKGNNESREAVCLRMKNGIAHT